MKPVTLEQWQRMQPRTRSWLALKTFEPGKFTVYWHIHDAGKFLAGTGSYHSKDYAWSVMRAWISKYPDMKHLAETGSVHRDIAFAGYAQYWGPLQSLIGHVHKRGLEVSIYWR